MQQESLLAACLFEGSLLSSTPPLPTPTPLNLHSRYPAHLLHTPPPSHNPTRPT